MSIYLGDELISGIKTVNGVEPDDNGNVELELPYIQESEKGTANGIASLGSDGKILISQLPIYDGTVV